MQRGALSDLDTFLLVAEHLSFRAAAKRLELTAPASATRYGSLRRGSAYGF
jgi:DNA-binding transcriptional LysR family regulator